MKYGGHLLQTMAFLSYFCSSARVPIIILTQHFLISSSISQNTINVNNQKIFVLNLNFAQIIYHYPASISLPVIISIFPPNQPFCLAGTSAPGLILRPRGHLDPPRFPIGLHMCYLCPIHQTSLIIDKFKLIKNYQIQRKLHSKQALPHLLLNTTSLQAIHDVHHGVTLYASFCSPSTLFLSHLHDRVLFKTTSSPSQSHVLSSFCSGLLLGNSWSLWLQSGRGALTYNIYLTAKKMGNQASKNASPVTQELVDQLGQLVRVQYSAPCRLGFNPFDLEPARVQPPNAADFAISSMVEQADETQPLSNPNAAADHPIAFVDSPSRTYTQLGVIQKNQCQSKLRKKAKKISKAPKPKSRNSWSAQSREDGDCNSNETVAADDSMRDQNNCKSYHKLVKNYLIQRGLGEEIDKYETKYHTRYYFIVGLIMIKHHLKEDFTDIYQKIVEKELAVQQRKIDRKLSQLHLTREKLESSHSRGQPTQMLRAKQANLQSQIEHIKVVKFQIEDYSMRSCRAFFQGEIEESLKILYLKNDPVMRKKYYFDQALLVVKELQSQMRKSHSHR